VGVDGHPISSSARLPQSSSSSSPLLSTRTLFRPRGGGWTLGEGVLELPATAEDGEEGSPAPLEGEGGGGGMVMAPDDLTYLRISPG